MTVRFPEISSVEIQKLAEKAVNKKSTKTSKTLMDFWKSWVENKGLNADIVKYEAKAKLSKSDGSDYEPDSLRVMLAALDRLFEHNNNKIFIAKDRGFVKCRQVGDGGKSKSSSRKRPQKMTKCNKSTYRPFGKKNACG